MLETENIEIVHRMNKQLVIRAGNCIKIKARLVDKDNNTVGRLMKIFGPVSNPYGLINLNEEISETNNLRLTC